MWPGGHSLETPALSEDIQYFLISTCSVTVHCCYTDQPLDYSIEYFNGAICMWLFRLCPFCLPPEKRKEKNKKLSNCQTLVTSVHAKLFILHLHQLNLVSLRPYYQLCLFHTLLVHADGDCSANSVRHN